ncbi:MAG: hypothetical protein Kow00114_23020 [Kiloniellaceae bacterium]
MSNSPDKRNYSAESAPLSALSHPEHVWLYDYWQAHRPAGGVPARRDIDPTEFPKRMLPRLAVIAVEAGAAGYRYRYRLAGTEIVSRAGRDPTGKTFEELYQGDYLTSAVGLYDELRKSAQPHFSQRVYPIGDGESFLRYDRLILPLAADHRTVDQFLLLIVVVEQSGAIHREGSFERAGKPKSR